ncbi:MAG: CPBP family intramembrane metalloprotease [Dehalococcoidia bacterium]|nr:CPBP family intramembrane metalloprotease [Dehalococcoidia bacterium]
MTGIDRLIRDRPVLSYFVLTFIVSWSLLLLIGGYDLFSGVDWDASSVFGLAIIAMLTGPTVASLVLTARLAGRAGVRDLFSRLRRWRVDIRWYAVALVTAPVVVLAVNLGLWLTSSAFRPPILSDEAGAVALLAGLGVGLTTVLEELGWTGFAVPRLRLRHTAFTTAVIVGVIWAAWHLIQIIWVGSSTAEGVPMAPYLAVYFLFAVASLTAYRVLMVWVHDATGSLFVVTLMHASYAACTLPIGLLVPKLTGSDLLVQGGALSAALWLVVAAVALLKRQEAMTQATPPSPAPPAAARSL